MHGAGSMASWMSCGSEIITTSGFSRKKTNMDFHVKMILYVIHICVLSCFRRVGLFATPWTVAQQAPLSMGFSRQEYCSGLPCPPPGDLPDPGIKPTSFMSPVLTGRLFTTTTNWEALITGEEIVDFNTIIHYCLPGIWSFFPNHQLIF